MPVEAVVRNDFPVATLAQILRLGHITRAVAAGSCLAAAATGLHNHRNEVTAVLRYLPTNLSRPEIAGER